MRQDVREMRPLVLDDNRHFRSIMRTVLRGFGVRQVREAPDALTAFELLKEETFDLVFLDLDMPEIDGFAFIDLVRNASDSTNQHLPIIVIAADARRSVVMRAVEQGADDFLTKPVKPAEVLKRLTALSLRHKREGTLDLPVAAPPANPA